MLGQKYSQGILSGLGLRKFLFTKEGGVNFIFINHLSDEDRGGGIYNFVKFLPYILKKLKKILDQNGISAPELFLIFLTFFCKTYTK